MTDEPWPSDWLRSVLGLCVLRAVDGGHAYGYAIASALDRVGLGAVKGGTLYPLLSRLEAAGLLVAQWQPGDGGPGRKYYALTAEGRRELADSATSWARFADLTSSFVNGQRAVPTASTVSTASQED